MAIQAASLYAMVNAETDRAEKNLHSVSTAFNRAGNSANSAERMFGGLNLGSVALGTVLGNMASGALNSAVNGLAGLANQTIRTAMFAYDATAGYERLKLSIESLAAREIARGKTSTQSSQVAMHMTDEEKKKVGELTDSYNKLFFQLDVMREKYAAMQGVDSNGKPKSSQAEQALAAYNIEAAEGKLSSYKKQIDELTAKEGQLATVTQKVVTGQMSLADAMKLAGPRAAELLGWIKQLAIHSPFDRQGIQDAFQTAMSYGFVSEKAQELTGVLVDWASGSGKTSQAIGLVSYALGQMRSTGKVLMQDLRQLMNAGVDVDFILGKMGYSLADVGDKEIKADDFLKMFVKTMKSDFGGAADRMTNSFDGLRSTLAEVAPDLMRAFATPVLEKFRAPLAKVVDLLTSDKLEKSLASLGTSVASVFGGQLKDAMTVLENFIGFMDVGVEPVEALYRSLRMMLPPDLMKNLDDLQKGLGNVFGGMANNDPKQFLGGLSGIGGVASGLFEQFMKPGLDAMWAKLKVWVDQKAKDLPSDTQKWGEAFIAWVEPSSPKFAEGLGKMFGAGAAWILTEGVPSLVRTIFVGFGLYGSEVEKVGNPFGAALMKGIADGFANSEGWQSVTTSWEQLKFLALFYLTEISMGVHTFFTDLDLTWKTNWTLVGIATRQLWTDIQNVISQKLIEIINSIKKFLTDTIALINSYKDTFVGLGASLMNWLLEGVRSATAAVIDAVRSAVGRAVTSAQEMFPMGMNVVGSNLEGRDSGGRGEAGKTYLIGRKAMPEAFVPFTAPSNGYFVPNADKSGGAVSKVTNHYWTLNANYANAQSEASLRDDVALLQMMAA